ncbi:hypothetical protein [Persicobacter diffluens]
MKNWLKYSMLTILAITALSACKDDDETADYIPNPFSSSRIIDTAGVDHPYYNGSIQNPTVANMEEMKDRGVVSIRGSLVFSDFDYSNEDIKTLNFLDSITGNLSFIADSTLTEIGGFENLLYIGGNLLIERNFLAKEINGFPNLGWIEGNITIKNNEVMSSLAGLSTLETFKGNLRIGVMPDLLSLEGLNKIDSVLELSIEGLGVQNLKGLESLEYVESNVMISSNPFLKSFEGLERINTLTRLDIAQNESLVSLDGLENLEVVTGEFRLLANDDLSSLVNLEKLNTVGGLNISSNNSLSNLDGLEQVNIALPNRQGALQIDTNASLAVSGMCGIKHLAEESVANDSFIWNVSLASGDRVNPQQVADLTCP